MPTSITKIDYLIPKNKNNLIKNRIFKKIFLKTGIRETYVVNNGEDVIDLAIKLGKRNKDSIKNCDGIIFVTQTPRYLLPSCSCIIQDKLKLPKNIMTFDINMGCSGFVHSLAVAKSLIENNTLKKVLIVCADTYNSYFYENNKNEYLFSDAASLIIVQKTKFEGIKNFSFGSDGSGYDKIIIKKNKKKNLEFEMSGADVFAFTLNTIPRIIKKFLSKNSLEFKNFKGIIFHQASKIVLENLKNKLMIKKNFIIDLKYGNTTSSSIPIALKHSIDKGSLKKGDLILICGFGVGLAWGVGTLRI
jgi:3-oxoacyl-[acyl-carrier-protein] synthase-3